MMKVILSRKGFDSEFGSSPSPIMPDGRMFSLPIPEPTCIGVAYDEIRLSGDLSAGALMDALRIRRPPHGAHLDPDLRAEVLERHKDWLPAFGQCAQAQGHLANQSVGVGDLFLFFGTFRRTRMLNGNLSWEPGAPRQHVIFGYLEVGEVVKVTKSTDLSWAARHPHIENKERPQNTVYVAATNSQLIAGKPGARAFSYDDRLTLTKPGGTLSQWRLPRCFHPAIAGTTLSYNTKPVHWSLAQDAAELRAASKGQEFVINGTRDILDWAESLIAH